MSGSPARLFVALELPGEARKALVAWASRSLSGIPGVRPLASEQLHVTLCFLGWQPEDAIGEIAEVCRGVGDSPGGLLTIEEALWLPPRRPRVVAVKLADDGDRAGRLQARLSGVLEHGGWYAPERRPYLPHVTVARVGARTRLRPFDLPAPPRRSFGASCVTLFRSRLGSGGARYEALERVGLG